MQTVKGCRVINYPRLVRLKINLPFDTQYVLHMLCVAHHRDN